MPRQVNLPTGIEGPASGARRDLLDSGPGQHESGDDLLLGGAPARGGRAPCRGRGGAILRLTLLSAWLAAGPAAAGPEGGQAARLRARQAEISAAAEDAVPALAALDGLARRFAADDPTADAEQAAAAARAYAVYKRLLLLMDEFATERKSYEFNMGLDYAVDALKNRRTDGAAQPLADAAALNAFNDAIYARLRLLQEGLRKEGTACESAHARSRSRRRRRWEAGAGAAAAAGCALLWFLIRRGDRPIDLEGP